MITDSVALSSGVTDSKVMPSTPWRDHRGGASSWLQGIRWGGGALAARLCLEALEVSEVRTSAAQKRASLAKRVGQEALIHSLCGCQSGICEMEN